MTIKSLSDSTSHTKKVRFISLTYNLAESQKSALQLILTLRPEWKDGKIEFIRFTDGITNTLLKVVNKLPGLSDEAIDKEAILLRAYGPGTDLIIDREQEAQNHEVLMQHGLAPELLARFQNGMLYRFIQGSVTSPEDLRKQDIWLAVARRLAQWHAVIPCVQHRAAEISSELNFNEYTSVCSSTPLTRSIKSHATINKTTSEIPSPNLWSVLQKWIHALPKSTKTERNRQESLQNELDRLIPEFSNRRGPSERSLVFAHCDLLSGNIIVQPWSKSDPNATLTVSFIDYEYATPSPAAFDISNHFAEWGGFKCDYHQLPTRSQRLNFIHEYIGSYYKHLKQELSVEDWELETNRLAAEVDDFRGIPGLYWGLWALIQAQISQIDFNYASYAEVRMDEYWAWRAESDGSRKASGKEMSLREARWAEN